jgi:hypothetical protein
MDEADGAAIMFMALCKQGRADAALKVALDAHFPDLIVGLSKMADACANNTEGEADRDFILAMERLLLDQKAGRPLFD